MTGGVGAYAIAGQDATLNYTAASTAYSLSAAPGSYALAGSEVNLVYTRFSPPASSGGIRWTWPIQQRRPLVNYRLRAEWGSYLISAAPTTMLIDRSNNEDAELLMLV